MENENLVKRTLLLFNEIVVKLLDPSYKVPLGGEGKRVMRNALKRLEKKYGALKCQRVVDYVVCSAYSLKNKEGKWTLNSVFGPKSLEKFNTNKGRIYFEDKWLKSENLTRAGLLEIIIDRSVHPKAKYIYLPSEEGTKMRLLNQKVGFTICQASTLGWSPISEACSLCEFTKKCKQETQKKYPEIYRLRTEYGD